MNKRQTAKRKGKKEPSWGQRNTQAAMGLIFFLSMAFLVFTSLLGDKSLFQLHKLQLEQDSWIVENARQAQENEKLGKKILAARDDLYIVEKIAREDLGLVKENEVIYLFNSGEIRRSGTANSMNRSLPDTRP